MPAANCKPYRAVSIVFELTRSTELKDLKRLDVLIMEVESAIKKNHVIHLHPLAARILHLKHLLYLKELSELMDAPERDFEKINLLNEILT